MQKLHKRGNTEVKCLKNRHWSVSYSIKFKERCQTRSLTVNWIFLLPVKAEREAEREAGEKALWARVSLGWLWRRDGRQDRHKKKKKKGRKTMSRELVCRRSISKAAADVQKLFSCRSFENSAWCSFAVALQNFWSDVFLITVFLQCSPVNNDDEAARRTEEDEPRRKMSPTNDV